MRRLLLSPRWLAGHVLMAACVVACLWLGRWQWDRVSAGGGGQSLGYALQWPLFAAFAVFAWTKVVRMERDRAAGRGTPVLPDEVPDGTTGPGSGSLADGWRRESPRGPAAPRGIAAGPGAAAPDRPAPADEEDDELIAYNRYLAQLAAEDRSR